MELREPASALKAFLAERGIRASWMAEKMGVSQWMFHHIEAGRKTKPDGWDERAAEILGVPVEMIRPEPEQVPA
jgi:ribose/xylose/arabinose/galactoside ABC-type transport system permease subunit